MNAKAKYIAFLVVGFIMGLLVGLQLQVQAFNENPNANESWDYMYITVHDKYYRNISRIKVYVAFPEKWSEGYKGKSSIDFLSLGCKGMIFIDPENSYHGKLVITMKNVNFPLKVAVLQRIIRDKYVVVKVATLEPGQTWVYEDLWDAFLELSPEVEIKENYFISFD